MTLPPPLSNPIFNGVTLSSLPSVSPDEVANFSHSLYLNRPQLISFPPLYLKLVLAFFPKSLQTLQIFLSLKAAFPHTLRLPRYPLCLKSQV